MFRLLNDNLYTVLQNDGLHPNSHIIATFFNQCLLKYYARHGRYGSCFISHVPCFFHFEIFKRWRSHSMRSEQ